MDTDAETQPTYIINTDIPAPREGLLGEWDRFIGPGATRAETILIVAASVVGVAAIVAAAVLTEPGWEGLQYILAGLLAFDVVGGVVANASASTKRWYQRNETRPVHRYGFVAMHAGHLALATFVFDLGWPWLGANVAALLVFGAITAWTGRHLQRPAGMLLSFVWITGAAILFPVPPLAAWVIPALALKLLLGHLVEEEPYYPAG